MEVFFGLVAWIGLAIAAGAIASSKRRSWFGYFVLTLLFPLIGLIIAAFISPIRDEALTRPYAPPPPAPQPSATRDPEKRCPMCAETIKAAAIKCRFCGADVSASAAAVEPADDAIARLQAAGFKVSEESGGRWRLRPVNGPIVYLDSRRELEGWADRFGTKR